MGEGASAKRHTYNPSVSRTLSLPSRLAVGFLELLCRVLPVRLLLGLAWLAGMLWYAFAPDRRRVAQENLRIAFGDALAPGDRRRIARASFRGLARVFVELAVADRVLGSPERAAERLRYVGDWAELEADARAGRTGLIVTGHLGNWEMGAVAIRRRQVPLAVMARPLDWPWLEAALTRQRGGADFVIPKVGGLTDVVRRLRHGDWVALMADQNAGRHGIFVPFFGLEASTFPTPAALGERFDLPIYVGTCLRRKGPPCSFDVHMRRLEPPPLDPHKEPHEDPHEDPDDDPDDESDREKRLERVTRAVNAQLEAWIRAEPEQYNWVHRRWKTRPPGRDESEPGRPAYARSWPMGPDGAPAHGRPLFDEARTSG